MKNNNFNNKNVKSVDTNENNKLNGDDFMKNNIDIMNKKTWKKLSKTDAYSHYAKLALKAIEAKELAEEAKAELLANREEILKYQDDLDDYGERIAELDAQIIQHEEELEILGDDFHKLQKENSSLKEERDHYKNKAEELELENAKGIGKADASLKINEEIEAELQKQAESITADYEVYDDCTDELSVKAGMINNFRKDIKRNNKAIAIAKHDIKMGVAVNRNKKWIRDLEAQNRYLQNQINGFQATFNEFKTQKTVVSETIDTKRSNYEELQDAWAVVSGVLNK